MLMASYSGIIGMLKIKKMVDEERELQQTALTILDRFSREIQQSNSTGTPLMPPCEDQNTSYGKGKNVYFFSDGNNRNGQRISFIAPGIGQMLPDGLQNTGTVQVTYHLEEPDRSREDLPEGTLALVRDEIPTIRPVEKACKKLVRFTTSNNVRSFVMKFYEPDNNNWVDQWDENAKGIPSLVSLDLEIVSQSGKVGRYSVIVNLPG